MGLTDIMGAMRPEPPKRRRRDRLNVAVNKFLLEAGTTDYEPREMGFHVSEMAFFCPRRFVLDLIFPENRPAPQTDVGLQRIFDVGHAYHHWYQNRYLGPAGILKGDWACLHCDHVHEGFMPKKCPGCGRDRRFLTFKEAPLEDRTLGVTINGVFWRLVGHSDGLIQLAEDEEEEVLELKTMDSDKWTKLEEPLWWNVNQVQIYMHLHEKERGRLVYINKNSNLTKEFVLQYDPGPWNDAVSKIGSIMRFFRQVDENKGVVKPEWIWEVRGPCKDLDARAAKSCHQVKPCFARARGGKKLTLATAVRAVVV